LARAYREEARRGPLLQGTKPPPHFMDSLPEITDLEPYDLCDVCGQPSDLLLRQAGDDVCERCSAVFTAAHALFDNEVEDRGAIVGTLAHAWSAYDIADSADQYTRFEMIGRVDDVPVLRLKAMSAYVVRYDNSDVAKAVKIDVFSRHVKPEKVVEEYGRVLQDHDIHHDQCSAGSVSWNMEKLCLALTVKAGAELAPWRVPYFKTYPSGRIYSFPPPSLVGGLYELFLGSFDDRNFSGYAYALEDYGRNTKKAAEKTINASLAWFLGEREDNVVPPLVRRPRIARILNRHLLGPCDRPELPEDRWRNDDTIWRDAKQTAPRLMRALYFLQEDRKQQFS